MTNKIKTGHRDRSDAVKFALFIVLIGVVFLGFNLGWFPAHYKPIVISWQMFLILLGINSFTERHWFWGTLLIAVGGFFLLPALGRVFPELGLGAVTFAAYWPMLLILCGVMILLGISGSRYRCCRKSDRCRRRSAGSAETEESSSDFVDKDIMFTSSEQIVFSSDFKGGDVNLGFGEIVLDLRRVEGLDPDNLLEVNTMFGETRILVPGNWQVNFVKSDSLFGAIEDRRSTLSPPDAGKEMAVLNLKVACFCGNVELRN